MKQALHISIHDSSDRIEVTDYKLTKGVNFNFTHDGLNRILQFDTLFGLDKAMRGEDALAYLVTYPKKGWRRIENCSAVFKEIDQTDNQTTTEP